MKPMERLDKITQIKIQGMRCIESLTIDLRGLTVLVGDNGTGKSTILEALAIMSKVTRRNFLNEVVGREHGGIVSLLRFGSPELVISVRIESSDAAPSICYTLALGVAGVYPVIAKELLEVFVQSDESRPLKAIDRTISGASVFHWKRKKLVSVDLQEDAESTVLSIYGKVQNIGQGAALPDAIKRVIRVFDALQVFAAFDVRPMWLGSESSLVSKIRQPATVERVNFLDRRGENLVNCFHTLRNDSELWATVLDYARLGLGQDLDDIITPAFSHGSIELQLKFASLPKPVPVSLLSNGQICFLAILAIVTLTQGRPGLLAYDEPELHLHPFLLARVVAMFEELAESHPVVLATHSDRLLDVLQNPAKSVILCEFSSNRSTVIKRVDQAALTEWLVDYRGLGQLRTEGYESFVFQEPTKE